MERQNGPLKSRCKNLEKVETNKQTRRLNTPTNLKGYCANLSTGKTTANMPAHGSATIDNDHNDKSRSGKPFLQKGLRRDTRFKSRMAGMKSNNNKWTLPGTIFSKMVPCDGVRLIKAVNGMAISPKCTSDSN